MSRDICNDCLHKQELDQDQEEDLDQDEQDFESEICSSQCQHEQEEKNAIKMRGFILMEIPRNQKTLLLEIPLEDEPKPPPLCRFFNKPGGCRYGDDCKFTHKVVKCHKPNCDKKKCIFAHSVSRYYDSPPEGFVKFTKGRTKQRVKPY